MPGGKNDVVDEDSARRDLRLHEFIAGRRADVLALCVAKVRERSPERNEVEIAADLEIVVDEIVRALQEDDGLPVTSPLPGRSASAGEHGARLQRSGHSVANLALDFGTISDSVGELGAREHRRFNSREYQTFNKCVDTAIASALDEYMAEARRENGGEAAERIGRFVHELRNALASAQMAFEVLRQGRVGASGRTGDVLGRSLRRLQALIDQTLLSVQLGANLMPERRPIRVTTLLHELAETAVPERGIGVHLEVSGDPHVLADERLLVSALSNLIQNAFKFTRDGGHIVLRARAEDPATVIEVEDECGGLPPGSVEDLFTPFVRRSADQRGLGLGLSITREAVIAQGGELVVRDLPGRGCVFGVKLPGAAPSVPFTR